MPHPSQLTKITGCPSIWAGTVNEAVSSSTHRYTPGV